MRLGLQNSLWTLLLAGLPMAMTSLNARANPLDGTVVAGSATINEAGKKLDINQATDRVVIDWRSFDIAPDEHTQFYQPSSNAIAVNRVNTTNPSRIAGQLTANGNVIIVNPNGVLFTATSMVDVNGVVATTADIDPHAFMNGSNHFNKPGNPQAVIENQGTITAKDAGLVGLVAPNVINSGTIQARLGRVQLGSGDTVTVDFYGDGLLEVKASDALTSQLVDNSGTLKAAGGLIAMTAAAGRETVNSVIKVNGELRAPSVGTKNGRIIIAAQSSAGTDKTGSSSVIIGGVLDVSGKNPNERGGSVSIAADHVILTPTAEINANGTVGGGEIHIGGDFQGAGTMPHAFTTDIAAGALITANALVEGNGGQVSVWADDRTVFDGRIEANGAGNDGEGGKVETSGRVALLINEGRVLANGRRKKGTWLLDPTDVDIDSAYAATIKASLDGGTNVTVATTAGAGNGDITVSSAITTTGLGSLTLSAYRHITVGAGITLQAGSLSLLADNTGTGAGTISITAAIANGAGAINFVANDLILSGSGSVTSTGILTIANAASAGTIGIGTGGGTLSIDTTEIGALTAGSYIFGSTTSGDLTINTTSGFGGKSVTFISGNDINLAGTITKAFSGATTYTFQADRDIYNSNGAGFSLNTSSNAVILNADYDQATVLGGRIAFTNANFTGVSTLVMGGGTDPLTGYAQGRAGAQEGIRLENNVLSVSNLTMHGRGYGAGSNNYGVYALGTSNDIRTSTTGLVVGIGGGDGVGTNNHGVYVAGGQLSGNVTVEGQGGNLSGTGGSNHGVYVGSSLRAAVIKGVKGGQADSYGVYNTGSGIYGTAATAIFTDTLFSSGALRANSGLTISTYTNIGISVGSNVIGTLNISNAMLANMSGNSSVTLGNVLLADGVTRSTGDLTITTNYDFADKHVTFISGRDIFLNATLTKAVGTGTANYNFYADRDIYNTSGRGVQATSGQINLLFNADRDGNGEGSITLIGSASFLSNGGNITLGGGTGTIAGVVFNTDGSIATAATGYAVGDAYSQYGVRLDSTLDAAGGNIVINGRGYAGAGDQNTGIVQNGTIRTSGSGAIALSGIGGGSGSSGSNYGIMTTGTINTTGAGRIGLAGYGGAGGTGTNQIGVYLNLGNLTGAGGDIFVNGTASGTAAGGNRGVLIRNTTRNTGNGNITIVGTGASALGSTGNDGINIYGASAVATASGTMSLRGTGGTNSYGIFLGAANAVSTTGGNLILRGIGNGTGQGVLVNTSDGASTTGGGNITVYTDSILLGAANSFNASGVLTLAPYTNVGMSLGTNVGGAFNIDDASLTNMNAGSYVFGAPINGNGTVNTTDLTIATTRDFADKNVTFLSSNDINLAGTLTRTGSGTVTYTFRANRDIYNSNGAGIAIASSPSTIILNADYDQATVPGGRIALTNATINAHNIVMGGGNNPLIGYAQGRAGAVEGIRLENVIFTGTLSSLSIRGHGYGIGSNNYGVYFLGTNTSNTAAGAGLIVGIGGGDGAGTNNHGVYAATGTMTANNVIVEGYGGNLGGTGGANHGVYVTGTLRPSVVKAVKGGQADSFGIYNINTGNIYGTNMTLYTDTLYSVGTLRSAGNPITLASYSNIGISIGSNVAGTLNINNSGLTSLGPNSSIIFGSTLLADGVTANTSDITISTAYDFNDRNVRFVAGRDIILNGTMNKNAGTGASTLTFEANRDIYNANSASIIATSGSLNLIFNADRDQLTTPGGAIELTNGTLTTNGGSVVMGGGLDPLTGYALANGSRTNGIHINSTPLVTNGGAITLHGKGTSHGILLTSTSLTSANGTMLLDGVSTVNGYGVRGSSGSINAGTGSVTLTGVGGGAVEGMLLFGNITGNGITLNGSIVLNANITLAGGAGDITLNGTVNSVSPLVARDLTLDTSGRVTTTGIIGGLYVLNNLSITADDVALGGNLNGTGTLTLQPKTTTQNMRLGGAYTGSTAGYLTLSATELGYLVDGWSSINLGRTNGTGQTYIGTGTWADPVNFYNNHKTVEGALTGTGNASFTFLNNGDVDVAADITTAGGAIDFSAPTYTSFTGGLRTLTSNGGNVTFRRILMRTSTSSANINSGGGNISVNDTIYTNANAAGQTLAFNAGAGIVNFGNTVDTAGNITASGSTITLGGDWGSTTPLGTVSLTSINGMTLPSITATSILARSTGVTSDMTIASGKTLTTSGTGNALVLAAGRHFINSSGSTALSAANGRWLVYSTSPANNTRGGLMPDASEFNKTYAGNAPSTIASGNRFIYSNATAPTIALTIDNDSVTYGDAYTAADLSYSYASGLVGGDIWGSIGLSGSAGLSTSYVQGATGYSPTAYASMINGATGTLASKLGYQFSFTAGNLAVNKRVITAALASAIKTYDGTNSASLGNGNFTYSNIYGSDVVGIAGVSGTFANENVGNGKAVSVSGLTLAGAQAANYQLASTNASANVGIINPRALSVVTNPQNRIDNAPEPTFTGSNNLLAADAALIVWTYAPIGYSGLLGTYTIGATASDPSNRLANYTRTNYYGTYTVTMNAPPPPTLVIPDSVLNAISRAPIVIGQVRVTTGDTEGANFTNGASDDGKGDEQWVDHDILDPYSSYVKNGYMLTVSPELKIILDTNLSI